MMHRITKLENACSVLAMLWQEMHAHDHWIINDIMRDEIPHKTQLRKYFQQAFYPFYEGKLPEVCSENYDALTRWVTYLRHYPYRSLLPVEHEFYETFYTVVENYAPSVTSRWMTPKQLADEYGFSESWQNKARMVSSGSTLPFHKVGKFIKYDRLEIDAWIEAHKVR